MSLLQNLKMLALLMTGAFLLTSAACTTSRPGSANALRRVVGTDLIGAKGATPVDQRKIDRTVAGICAVDDIWTRDECAAHGANR